ncbi:putative phosphomevalonate kinase [Hyphodiscus hymeniophilus]|uniref:phosphomevalonate kinase n=1 Tax=Hyphodiscus hymeniophilus TaxID=353542 RepID=A0A9P6VRC9_9HELO|nr:putative phosphomevalonate kinase [Hyphodiscus hymeniophilus]
MPTAVSAPGKVFLAGGYLVLDRAYTALVFGLSARVHVLVTDIDTSSGVQLSEIVVQSPQFRDATWNYGYHLAPESGGVDVTQLQGASSAALSKNLFVETALSYALTYISSILPSHLIKPARVTILADNDYYSQPSSSQDVPRSTPASDPTTKTFTDFNVRLTDAHKTGLGSSAALVTAFTGALLTHYLPSKAFELSSPSGQTILHNLSQASHCAAQGKIGSGFDVATAVYGTCVYRRFSPSILSSLGEPGSPGFSLRVKDVVEDPSQKWDTDISKHGASIPPGMALVMCDVDCGSHTPSMVKKVLAWRSSDPSVSKTLFDTLQKSNERLAALLSTTPAPLCRSSRARARSGVPIEPREQTELLDAVTKSVDGVAGAWSLGRGAMMRLCCW